MCFLKGGVLTGILFCNCIAAALISLPEWIWVSLVAWQRCTVASVNIPHHGVNNNSTNAVPPPQQQTRGWRFSWQFMGTYYSHCRLEHRPLLWIDAWLVIDKEKGIILLQHAIWVPKSIGYLNVEDAVFESLTVILLQFYCPFLCETECGQLVKLGSSGG